MSLRSDVEDGIDRDFAAEEEARGIAEAEARKLKRHNAAVKANATRKARKLPQAAEQIPPVDTL